MGFSSFILAQKLKALKVDLKKWNREVFGDLNFRKKNLLTELMGFDAREELVCLSNEDHVRLNCINHLVGFIPCRIFLYFSN